MIREQIRIDVKRFHVKGGHADVFGEDSDIRRRMDDNQILERFAAVWEQKIEPELRNASIIEYEEARELLPDGKAAAHVLPRFQYRYFALDHAFFLARLNEEADDQGDCSQLRPLGAHRDPLRLCVYFDSAEDRNRFSEISKGLALDEKNLGLRLLMDFVQKFSRKLP